VGARDTHLEFWDPLLSPERLKLETSNMAKIWRAVSTYKNAKLGQRRSCGGRDPHLEFWDPLISPERLKLETSNLAKG